MMISYGVPIDFMDQYIRISESTIIESFKRFVTPIFRCLSTHGLPGGCSPTQMRDLVRDPKCDEKVGGDA